MRRWLRDPVPEMPEKPETSSSNAAAVAQHSVAGCSAATDGISGISGISNIEEVPSPHLVPEAQPSAPQDTGEDHKAAARLQAADWSTDDWKMYFDERAAILQFDHGLPRPEAEARAFQVCIGEWLSRNPVNSASFACLGCGAADRPNDPLLAIGIAGAGQTWLHRNCVSGWHSGRIAAATAALRAMNIAP